MCITRIVMTLDMLIQGRMGINTIRFGAENSGWLQAAPSLLVRNSILLALPEGFMVLKGYAYGYVEVSV